MILVCAPSLHRNRLGQVAGLVDVAAFDGGDVVGQELEGDDGQQGDEAFFGVGDFYGVVGQVADDGVAAGNYSDYPTLPGFDFVDVADHLIIHGLVIGGYHYYGHFLVYEGNGTMLHLGGGIPLGMDVRDFLEFQGTFQRHRVVVAPAQIDEIAGVGEDAGEFADEVAHLQGFFHFGRDGGQGGDQLFKTGFGQGAAHPGHAQGHQGKDGDLRGKGFCRGHPNLGPRVGIGSRVGASGDGGAHHVADAVDKDIPAARQFHRCQRISRLAGLRNGHHYVIGKENRVAIAEFRGVFHFHGQARKGLDQVFADEAGVPRGAAGDDDDPPGLFKAFAVVQDAREGDRVVFHVDASAHAFAQGVGLLEDFLEHEVRGAAFFQLAQGEFQFNDAVVLFHLLQVVELRLPVPAQADYFLVVQVDDLFGVFNNGRGVRGQEVFPLPYAYEQRAGFTGCYHGVGIVLLDDGYGVSAYHLGQGQLHGVEQVGVAGSPHVLDPLDQHLGVRIALKGVAFAQEGFFQDGVVFYDAVVDQGQLPGLGVMGMGVDVAGFAVGGPAGVGDADGACGVFSLDVACQVGYFAFGFVDSQLVCLVVCRVDDRQAGAVVASVFEASLVPMYPTMPHIFMFF